MNLTQVEAPPFEPVTLVEVWAHLRIIPVGSPAATEDDAMLERHIAAAREHVEVMARRSLVRRPLRLSMSRWPQARTWWSPEPSRNEVTAIYLLRPPLVEVTSVRYYDAENTLQTLDPALYYTTDEQVPQLRFSSGFSTLTLYDRPDAVQVNYVAGYTPAGSPPTSQAEYAAKIPQALKQAVLLGVQLLYDDLLPDDRAAIEAARESIVQPWRVQLAQGK